jgi:glycerol kinase
LAVPSFTMTSGPVPESLGKGYVKGPAVESAEERASLAALYCAQMVSEQLDAITSKDDIIVDGPFSQNPVLLAVLAALRPAQKVKASALRDGTTAGAAALAMIGGQLFGARIGSGLVIHRGSALIRPVFLTVVFAMTIKLLWDAWGQS